MITKQRIIIANFIIIIALALTFAISDAPTSQATTAPITAHVRVHTDTRGAYRHWRFQVWRHALYVQWIAQLQAQQHAVNRLPQASGSLYAQWYRISMCEEGGGWFNSGYAFPNSLGITRRNWFNNGGGSDVSASAQIAVAQRVNGYGPVPTHCPW